MLYCITFNMLLSHIKFIFYLYLFVSVIYTICLHDADFRVYSHVVGTVLQSSFYFSFDSDFYFLSHSFIDTTHELLLHQ